MTAGIAAALVASVVIGLSLGLLGGGGSILTVPVLVYLAGIEPKTAIAMSLFVVGATAAAGVIPHARAGHVRWGTGLVFGAAGMAGAYAGGRLAAHLPGDVLLAGFATLMIAAAVVMLRPRPIGPPSAAQGTGKRPVARILAGGAVIGLLTGLAGAGGGFLIVPALAILGRLTMRVAVGTSLLVIALNAAAGLTGHLSTAGIEWRLTLGVTALAVAGSLIGARLCGRVNPGTLRRSFGWLLITIGTGVLAGQLVH